MRDKKNKKQKDQRTDKNGRRLMEFKAKQNNSTNFSDVNAVQKHTEMVSQQLFDAFTVIIDNCDQMLMKVRKKPLCFTIGIIKRTAEQALYLNNKFTNSF